MKRFSRISEFEAMNEMDISKVRGGLMAPTRLNVTVISTTANCTCNENGIPDTCTDTGQGTVCIEDPDPK
jgi:hypothetical protein